MLMENFELTGLPEMLRQSWANACEIVRTGGVCHHPTSGHVAVASLTSVDLYVINNHKCRCKGYEIRNMCAHVLAAAHQTDTMLRAVTSYRPPKASSLLPKSPDAGRKPNHHPRKRLPPHQQLPINRSLFRPAIELSQTSSEPAEKIIKFVRLIDTQSTVCYGCGGMFRQKRNDPPPPPPYDIVITTTLRRAFRKRNTNRVTISSTPENVYFHIFRSCLTQQGVLLKKDNFINDVRPIFLKECHKLKVLKEFGINL